MLESPQLPYGLRDIKLIPLDADENEGTPVDLPVAQTFSFSEAEEFETLRGDDRDVAIHGRGPLVDFELGAGGISLEAWQVMTGGSLVNAGVTPNQSKEFTKKVTDARPYFKVIGQIINDVNGDTHAEVFKCKITDTLEGEWADGTFFVTSASGQGIGNADGDLYRITWHETATALSGGVNELQQIISDATGGTFTITYSAQTTSALAFNVTALAMQTALEALSNLAPGDVLVTGSAGNWVIEFRGTLAATNVAQVTLGVGSLTGGTAVALTQRQGAAA